MARYVRHTVQYASSSTSFTPTLPVHENGDLILAFMGNDWTSNGYSTATSGWTKEEEVTGTCNAACFSFYATGSGSTNPTFTTTTGRGWAVVLVVIKDAPTSAAKDVSASSSPASFFRDTTQTVTTTTNHCLLLEYVMQEENNRQMFFEPEVNQIAQLNGTPVSFEHSAILGWHVQQTAGLSTGHTFANRFSSFNGVKLTIAIKDDGNANYPGYVDPVTHPAELMTPWSGTNSLAYYDDSSKDVDPTSLITTINGGTASYKADGSFNGVYPRIDTSGFSITSSGDWDKHLVWQRGLGNTWDLSGDALVSFTAISEDISVDFNTGARYLGFGSGDSSNVATAAVLFQYESSDAKVRMDDGSTQYVIQPSQTADETYGTIALASIAKLFQSTYVTTSDQDHGIGFVYKLGTMILIGGSAAHPCEFSVAASHAKTGALNTIKNQKGSAASQYFCAQNVQTGNGTQSCYWDSSFQAIEFPSAYSTTSVNIGVNTASATFKYNIKAAAGDTVVMKSCTFNMGDYHKWEIDSATSDTNIYNFTGLNVLNATVTLQNKANINYGGITFSGCKEIVHNSANLSDGVTISNCVDTYAITVTNKTDFERLQNCDFKGNNYSIRITGNHSGTSPWSAAGMTVSGGTGSYDIRYEGTGTLEIQCDTGSGFQQSRAEATVGTLTISAPTLSLTVNSSESGSDIKIFTTNTQTIETSATGTTASTTNTGTYDWTVQKAGFIPQRGTGVALSSTSVTVDVTLVEDPIYNVSHGLLFGTDYSYNASTRVMTIVANQEGRDLYSAMINAFISETSLRNCPFPLVAVGPDRIDFKAVGYYNTATTVGATIDAGDIQFWKGAGMEWEHDTTGNPTKKFYSIKSANTLQAGTVVGYTQVNNGTPVESTLVSNQVNEVIQFFEDTDGNGTPDYNYTGHLLFKGFLTGYYQARWDVINDSGITTLEPYEYTINLLQDAISGTTGDQAITITTLTDHTGAPLSVGGKSFDYELVDPGTNTAEDLLAQHNYNVYNAVNTAIAGSLYTSYTAFDLPDLVVEAGSSYETERGYFEGDGAVTDLSGVYLSRSSSDHPDISRFQSNDGTYYTPAVTANATGTNLPDDVGGNTRLQIANLTAISASAWQATTAYSVGDIVLRTTGAGSENTAGLFFRCTSAGTSGGTEPTWVITTPGVFGTSGSETTDNTVTWECFAILLYDADPASTGWSDTYIDGYEFAGGETARIRFAHLNGATSFESGQATAAVTTSGFSFDGSLFVTSDSIYATNAIDGSSLTTTFSPDYGNNELDLDTNTDFQGIGVYAYYCYELTTTDGMHTAWGAFTALDVSNYRNNTTTFALYLDETAGFVKQTDSVRIFNDLGTRPARDPTTGGNGIEVNWRNPVYGYDAGGGGFTASDRAVLNAAATQSSVNTVDSNVDAILVDTGTTLPATLSTIEGKVDTVDTNVDAILVDTGTTIPAQITALNDFDPAVDTVARVTLCDTVTVNTDMRGTDGANTTAPDNASITAIKAKTDSLTFTKANELDANIQSVNDVTVNGTGASGDEWGP